MAQLLDEADGAEVRKAEQKQIGWYKFSLTQEGRRDSLFKGLNSTLDVLQWHEDSFDVPLDAVLLAMSDTCRNQAIRIGRYAWGP